MVSDCRGRQCLLVGVVLVGLLMSWEQSKRGGAEHQVVLVHRRSPLGPVSDGGSPLAAPSPAPTAAAATRARLRSVPEPAARALLRSSLPVAEPPAWVEDHEPRTRALLGLFALFSAGGAMFCYAFVVETRGAALSDVQRLFTDQPPSEGDALLAPRV